MIQNTFNRRVVLSVWPWILVGLNFILNILFVTSNSLANDEPFSVYMAQLNVTEIIKHLITGNNGPMYEILLHFWIKVFGISIMSVRFLSVLFCSLSVYFVYRIATDIYGKWVGTTAALIFSSADFHIIFAHEARAYPLFLLLTLVAISTFLKVIRGTTEKKHLIVLVIANVLLVYTHYLAVFVWLIQAASVLCIPSVRKVHWRKFLVVSLVILVLCIPVLVILIPRLYAMKNGSWVPPPDGLNALYDMIWSFSNTPVITVLSISVVVLAGLAAIVRKLYQKVEKETVILLIWFFCPLLVTFSVSFIFPFFIERYLIYISPAWYILIASSCVSLFKNRWTGRVICLLFVFSYAITFNANRDNRRNVKETVQFIKDNTRSNTMVLISPRYFIPNYVYYSDIDVFKKADPEGFYEKMISEMQCKNVFAASDPGQIPVKYSDTLLYLDAGDEFSAMAFRTSLSKTHNLICNNTFGECFSVSLWVLSP